MFTFAYPELLFLLLLLPIILLLYLWAYYDKTRRLKKFGNPLVLRTLMPDYSSYKPQIPQDQT